MFWALSRLWFFLVGVGVAAELYAHDHSIQFAHQSQPVQTLICRGGVHVEIQANSQANKTSWAPDIEAKVLSGGRLSLGAKKAGQVVRLSGRYFKDGLQRIELYDQCSMKISGLSGGQLIVHSETSGDIELGGYVPLSKLVQKVANSIRVVWVNSDHLEVLSQAGQLSMAGRARHLKMRASGSSQIEAGHLRGHSLWLWLSGSARVYGNSGSNFVAYAHAKGQAILSGSPMFAQIFSGENASVSREWRN